MLFAVIHPAQQRLDRTPLVSLRLVGGNEFEIHKRSLKFLAFRPWQTPPAIATYRNATLSAAYKPCAEAPAGCGRNNLFYRWKIQKCVDVPSIEKNRSGWDS